MTSGLRTEYRIFVGLGVALILLGVFEIALGFVDQPKSTVWGIDAGGIGMIVGGVSAVLGTHWYHETRT